MNKIDDFLIEIPKIEKIINYTFKNKDLLIHSFIHPSYNNNNNPNYERLEFLGDSIINFHTTSWLYKNKKEFKPGQLTIRRAQIINNNLLSSLIKLLKLNDYILVGKNVDINAKICSDVYESLIAAIFLDSNIKKTFIFFNNTVIKNIKSFSKIIDYKGLLITYFQLKECYDFSFNTNYNNNLKKFISYINIDNKHLYGFGKNKKIAEMNVSEITVKILKS